MKKKYSVSKGASPGSASAIGGQKAGEAILRNLNNRTRIRNADLAKWLLDNSAPQNPDEKLREFLELLELYYDGKFDDFALVTAVLARSDADPENVSGVYDEFLRRHRDRINGEVWNLTADWYPDRQEEFRRRVEQRLDAMLTWYLDAWEKAKEILALPCDLYGGFCRPRNWNPPRSIHTTCEHLAATPVASAAKRHHGGPQPTAHLFTFFTAYKKGMLRGKPPGPPGFRRRIGKRSVNCCEWRKCTKGTAGGRQEPRNEI